MSDFITLKDNRDFSRLYRRGKSFVSPVLVTYVIKNKSDNLRFGITTGKKVGKAVKRTRARRVIRAAYYQLYNDLKPGYDFVFVARSRTPFVKSQNVGIIKLSKIEKGMEVVKGTILGKIRTIGVDTDVKSPAKGILKEILVSDQASVDFAKPLFIIEVL